MKYLIVSLSFFFGVITLDVQAISIGLGASVSEYSLSALEKDDQNNEVAKFSSGVSLSPTFSFNSNPDYFGKSRFGWLLEFNLGVISESTQDLTAAMGDQNYEGSIDGIFSHFNPIIFYRWGDKQNNRGVHRWWLSAGLGYGFSYLQLDGSYLATTDVSAERKIVTLDEEKGLFLLPAALVEYSLHNWFVKFTVCFGGSGFVVDDYVYKFSYRSINLGRSFDF